MAIRACTRLGVYGVVAQIGAGGMGVVYRAHYSRLNRGVALKVSSHSIIRIMQLSSCR
jgi:serine/threonine protein kinase